MDHRQGDRVGDGWIWLRIMSNRGRGVELWGSVTTVLVYRWPTIVPADDGLNTPVSVNTSGLNDAKDREISQYQIL
jgi:hypothetical protein